MAQYRITLTCKGFTEAEGQLAPSDFLKEFCHRTWHRDVQCRWENGLLRLTATNDFDVNGEALFDEFWDVVIACCAWSETLSFHIESVERL